MHFRLMLLCFLTGLTSSGRAQEVALTVTEPSGIERAGWPVTSGIPLAQAELRSHRHTALFDTDGLEVPLQTEVLSRWPDGTIRWLLLDFQVDLAADESQSFVLRYGPEVTRASVPDPITLQDVVGPPPERLALDRWESGPLRIESTLERFRLFDAVWLDQDGDGEFSAAERMTDPAAVGIVLVGPDGTRYRTDFAHPKMTVEQHGPIRACVRIEGTHRAEDNRELFGYIVRLHLYHGQPFVKFDYTFINDYQDTLMAQIEAIELVLNTNSDEDNVLVLGGQATEPALLYQVDDQQFEINGQKSGQRAPGWAAVGSPRGGMAVGVHQFWQNWPKSLEVKPGELRIGLCPDFDSGRYDGHPIMEEAKHYYYLRDGVYTFKIGMARTHQLWANFFADEPDVAALADFYRATEKPLLAQCSPDYVCATGVLGDAPPADPQKYHGYDAWLDASFQKHLEDQDRVRENGMLNFGDWWDGKKFGGGWGNQEYDTSHIFFTQYLRSGDRRYFDRARQGAWHLMDVDTLHAVNPHIYGLNHHGEPQPGHIWTHSVGHTGGYYDEAPLEASNWMQGGALQNLGHVWIGGLSDCYVLTGNLRALDVAILAADRLASLCPVGYSDHIRALGWPLNAVMTAYEMTGDDKYLSAADRQWELLRSNLDPERGWVVMLAYGHCSHQGKAGRCRGQNTYMLGLTLSALARYHQATGDPEVLQALSIGLDQMIRESWSEEGKSFYATACTHIRSEPPGPFSTSTLLGARAFAHEIGHTGNQEHRRIFNESFRRTVVAGMESVESGDPQSQAGYASRAFHFTPYGLRALED
jgi:hypothetical protein